MRLSKTAGVVGLLLLSAPAAAQVWTDVAVFGDSLSDVGNIAALTFGLVPASPPHFGGRFSNGILWHEHVSDGLAIGRAAPSRRGGRAYAHGGVKTGSGNTVIFPLFLPNVGTQINGYLDAVTPAASTLHLVYAGANDFFDGQSNPAVPANNLSGHIAALAAAGARYFVVPNLPPLGQTPRFRGTADEAAMDQRTQQFNAALSDVLDNLRSSLGVHIFAVDVAAGLGRVLADPAAWGIANTTGRAYNGSAVVPDPNTYLFWDDVHPTARGHEIIAQFALESIHTRRWLSADGAWSTPANWDVPGAPAGAWRVEIVNATLPAGMVSRVSADAAVDRVRVRGDAGAALLTVDAGATLTAPGGVAIEAGGALAGGGTVAGDVASAGEVRPLPQGLSIAGDYEQAATARLSVDLAGSSAYGRLAVSGAATLAGAVHVGAAGAFVPLPGESFDVLTAASVAGTASAVNATGYAGLVFEARLDADRLWINAGALFDGDADLDGRVDVSDLGALATNWQRSADWLGGDFDGSGQVDVVDLGVLATNWLSGLTGPFAPDALATGASGAAAAIPEPRAAALLVAAGLVARRRRR